MPIPNANGAGTKHNSDQNSDGVIIGQTDSDKVGFHGKSVVQHTTNPGGLTQDLGGGGVTIDTIFNGNLTGTNGKGFYTIQALVRALKDKGILDLNGGTSQV